MAGYVIDIGGVLGAKSPLEPLVFYDSIGPQTALRGIYVHG